MVCQRTMKTKGGVRRVCGALVFVAIAIGIVRRQSVGVRCVRFSILEEGVIGLHELRHFVDRILWRIDLVEIVHPAGELRRNGPLGSAFLLLEIALAALLAFGWGRRAEVTLASTGLARTAGPWRTEAAGARSTKAARSRGPAKTTWAAGPGTAKAAAGARSAEAAARSRGPARAAILACPRFADGQRSTHEQLAIELLDGSLGTGTVGIFHEGESTSAPGLAVERADDLCRLTNRGEVRPQVFFGGLVREITYEQSDRWHGIVEEGRVRLVRSSSITKTLQSAKLGLQGVKFETKHVAMRRATGRLQLGLRVRERELQYCASLHVRSLVGRELRPPVGRGPGVLLL
jgi:hypothetical protein